ncbi:MAG: suppressor of fused domain protein [Phycisphaeraceae bacterium]
MPELPEERSDGGSYIFRYKERTIPFQPTAGDGEHIERISDHIEKHIGPIHMVFHEIVSDLVHIDVHWVRPNNQRPYHTLITSGMSEAPMSMPTGEGDAVVPAYAELCICLPSLWPLTQEDFKDERNYWPIRWLKTMARLPHEYDTWLWYGHTVPNGDPAEPVSKDSKFIGFVVLSPVSAPQEFTELKIDEDKSIYFFAIYPLFREEMDLKLCEGTDALIDKLAEHEVTEVVDVKRKNTCRKKRWGLF